MKIIIDLSPVSVIQCAYRLQFYDDLPKAHEVCFVGLLKFYAIIVYFQFLLTLIRNALSFELYTKSLLIDSFQKAMSEVVINLERCSYYFIAIFLIDDHCEAIIREIREICVRFISQY